jgi:general secretion pathway protein G
MAKTQSNCPPVIIAFLLLAGCTWQPLSSTDERRAALVRTQIAAIVAALEQYKQDTGMYPSAEDGLHALQVNKVPRSGWAGPYLERDIPRDPWGRAYVYRFEEGGRPPIVICRGRDGLEGGKGEDGDIVGTFRDTRVTSTRDAAKNPDR